ncbi:CinA family protein [Halomonas sp. H10-59]|uniref:CinA family protein n=1 Tax=Halomonas sp. H10-59 TaxID=2950874 RepID=A0AAU7KTJ6_9GAMM|nr:CinA family protein [Halomonas sp. BN3-1]
MEWLEDLVDYLTEHDIKLATAESCTAGLIASELARVPGSGQVIDSGLAVYSPEAKNRYLGIPFETISRYGLTGEEITREMVLGTLNNSNAKLAIANTGIAGPGEPEDGPPKGTVCLGWGFRYEDKIYVVTTTEHFDGDRNEVRLAAAHHALKRVCDWHRDIRDGKLAPYWREHD